MSLLRQFWFQLRILEKTYVHQRCKVDSPLVSLCLRITSLLALDFSLIPCWNVSSFFHSFACDLQTRRHTHTVFEVPPRDDHLSAHLEHCGHCLSSSRTHPLPADLFGAHGRPRSHWEAAVHQLVRWPNCTMSRLPPSWSAGDQVDGDSDARAKLTRIATTDRAGARWGLTPGNRLSCPGWTAAHSTWILIVFTSVVCVISGWQPGFPHWRCLPRRLDGTTARS